MNPRICGHRVVDWSVIFLATYVHSDSLCRVLSLRSKWTNLIQNRPLSRRTLPLTAEVGLLLPTIDPPLESLEAHPTRPDAASTLFSLRTGSFKPRSVARLHVPNSGALVRFSVQLNCPLDARQSVTAWIRDHSPGIYFEIILRVYM